MLDRKILILSFLAIALVAYFRLYNRVDLERSDDPLDLAYESFIAEYRRSYPSTSEYEYRRQIFKKTFDFINEFNAGNNTWTLGINQFADLTDEEYDTICAIVPSAEESNHEYVSSKRSPNQVTWTDIDWRQPQGKYVLTSKDQGTRCNSCWAFSTTASIQAAWVKYNQDDLGNDISAPELSVQQLVDCDTGSSGCTSGRTDSSTQYYMSNRPKLASDYPYTQRAGTCNAGNYPNAFDRLVTDIDYDEPYIPDDIRESLDDGVVIASVAKGSAVFRNYRSGIISGASWYYRVNHSVTVVGYNSNPGGQSYWIIQNSYGTSWGQQGFAHISTEVYRPSGSTNNVGVCGINTYSLIPTYKPP